MNKQLLKNVDKILFLIIIILLLIISPVGAEDIGQTNLSAHVSEIVIDADITVSIIGYTVNGEANLDRVLVFPADTVNIHLNRTPIGMTFQAIVEWEDRTDVLKGDTIQIRDFPRDHPATIPVHLSLTTASTSGGGGYVSPPDTPSEDNPTDTPGSDEPLVPILPPAGNVYNIAGFIPLFAGFFLLFLLFFWRRKVYRILKKHAKRHGEKPERKQLKATADAIIQLIRDEEKYPKWRKNSELTTRLSADIISALDEMQYPPTIPRDAVVADIIKSAKGRINRHRL